MNFLNGITVRMEKKLYICGDFNIDLLKHSVHGKTQQFIDNLYALGFSPLIDKPTRITLNTSTLIDNVFTNETESIIKSGLAISDISDHLPVFSTTKYIKRERNITEVKFVRNKNNDAITALKSELDRINLDEIYNTNDVNTANDMFINSIKTHYKHCPIKEKHIYTYNNKPWFTNELKHACRKRNPLYKFFSKKEKKRK